MGRQGDPSRQQKASDLLNFHFTSAPPPRQSPQTQNNRNRNRAGRGRGNHHSRQQQQNKQYRRSKQDRASSRRKASQNHFYLHSSPDHTFVITRIPNRNQQYTFNGPDEAVSWESVRLVRYLCTSPDEPCPICLDAFCCPRITKCGHSFCLPCIIHHVQAHTANNPYATDGPKCPCCALPLHLDDMRPVEFQLVLAAHHQQLQRQSFCKLHRVKNCPSPFLPLPTAPRRSSPHAAPCQTDADAPFSKFTYVDPHKYQCQLQDNLRDLEAQLRQQQQTTTTITATSMNGTIEQVCTRLALERVQHEIQTSGAQVDQELELMERFQNPAAGMYQPHPTPLLASSTASTDTVCVRHRGESIGSESFHSVSSAGGGGDDGESCSLASRVPGTMIQASMFLDQEETAFYQAEDGSLCFLSGFNMNCLRTEFSATRPEEQQQQIPSNSPGSLHKGMPLPDKVEGRVVEVERVNLTPQLRSRLRFLSHLPVYSDICFVEISLGSILSAETKKVFKKEFHKRKQTRESRIKAELRADEKAKKEEQARIEELKARSQRIDPEDVFFHGPSFEESLPPPTGDDFGPSLGTSPPSAAQQTAASFSFSQITREGGAFPSLASSTGNEFPLLGSSPPAAAAAASRPTWGPPPKKTVVAPPPSPPAKMGGKKRGKGKKVLLFSTGSHRGATS